MQLHLDIPVRGHLTPAPKDLVWFLDGARWTALLVQKVTRTEVSGTTSGGRRTVALAQLRRSPGGPRG